MDHIFTVVSAEQVAKYLNIVVNGIEASYRHVKTD